MRRSPTSTAFAAGMTLAVLVAAGCGSGDDTSIAPTVVTPPPSSAVPAPTPTVPPVPTALLPGTTGGDPVYPEPTSPPSEPIVTVPPVVSVAPTTEATASTMPGSSVPATEPVNTEPIAIQELVLGGAGIGSAALGTDPDAVVQYVTSLLGGNTADSGWVDPDTFGFCPGSSVRRVDWGVLSLLFADASDLATGRRHFIGWEYGRLGEIGDEPAGLHTAGGVRLGSRVADVAAEFPEVSILEGDPELELPDQFYVDDSFSGWLSGVADDDFVTVMFGGFRCGG